MCLMCGDEYKVDVPLSPLLNHTSVVVCVDRVVMCLMCGDEYKVDVPLSPLLNHTSVAMCVLTGW